MLLATGASTEVAEVIKRHTAKLSINDNERVAAAIDHYEPHIDFCSSRAVLCVST